MNKIRSSIPFFLLLSVFFFFSCSPSFLDTPIYLNDYVPLEDIPSTSDVKTKKTNPTLEKEVEASFSNNLWKAAITSNNSSTTSVYLKITDSTKNLIEFNTSSSLKTYNYKVIDGNWIVLTNKTNTVVMKYVKKEENNIYLIIPSSYINSSFTDLGCSIVLSISSDNVTFENNNNPNDEKEDNEELNPTPDHNPVPPKEEQYKIISQDEFYNFINNGNFNYVYFNFFDEPNQPTGEFLSCEKGLITITTNLIQIKGSNGYSPKFEFNILNVEKKIKGIDDVVIATIQIQNSSDEKTPNGIYYLMYDKETNKEANLMMFSSNFQLIFSTTSSSSSVNIKEITIKNDMFEKLMGNIIRNDNFIITFILEGEMKPSIYENVIFINNKMYVNNEYVADFKITKAKYGMEGGNRYYRACSWFEITFSNSTLPFIANTSYNFFIFNQTNVFNGYSDGYTSLFLGPSSVPVTLYPVSINDFITELKQKLNIKMKIEESENEIQGLYELVKNEGNNTYNIVNEQNDVYVNFKLLEAALMGPKGSQMYYASIKILESKSSVLEKDKYYQLAIYDTSVSFSEYDSDCNFVLKGNI